MYKDKNLDKTPTARELMDIIVESREWKDTDFCSFPLGKSIITLSKSMWNYHLLYNNYHLQEYDKRKDTFIIDKYYSSPEAAFLELLQTYDEIGYRALKGYIEEEEKNAIPTYKDLNKIQTAKYPAEIIKKAETWAYGDSCIFLFGDDKYTLTKIPDDYYPYRISKESVKNEELMNIWKADVEDKLHTRKMNIYKYPGRNNYGIPLYELEEIIVENRLSFEKYEKIGDNSPEFVCKMHREWDNSRDYYILINLQYPGCDDEKMTEVFEKSILPAMQDMYHSKDMEPEEEYEHCD